MKKTLLILTITLLFVYILINIPFSLQKEEMSTKSLESKISYKSKKESYVIDRGFLCTKDSYKDIWLNPVFHVSKIEGINCPLHSKFNLYNANSVLDGISIEYGSSFIEFFKNTFYINGNIILNKNNQLKLSLYPLKYTNNKITPNSPIKTKSILTHTNKDLIIGSAVLDITLKNPIDPLYKISLQQGETGVSKEALNDQLLSDINKALNDADDQNIKKILLFFKKAFSTNEKQSIKIKITNKSNISLIQFVAIASSMPANFIGTLFSENFNIQVERR